MVIEARATNWMTATSGLHHYLKLPGPRFFCRIAKVAGCSILLMTLLGWHLEKYDAAAFVFFLCAGCLLLFIERSVLASIWLLSPLLKLFARDIAVKINPVDSTVSITVEMGRLRGKSIALCKRVQRLLPEKPLLFSKVVTNDDGVLFLGRLMLFWFFLPRESFVNSSDYGEIRKIMDQSSVWYFAGEIDDCYPSKSTGDLL